MKKTIPVILAVLMTLSFSSCSKEAKDTEKAESPVTSGGSVSNESIEEDNSSSESSKSEDSDDSTAGYDAYTDELISTGYISKVKDNGDGSWTLTVTDKWNKMSKSDKEDFANDIFGELCEKADQQYGVLASVKMVDKSNTTVAVSSQDGGGMKIYE